MRLPYHTGIGRQVSALIVVRRCTMSLNVALFTVIPDETERVAKAAFPTGNRYLLLRDTFGPDRQPRLRAPVLARGPPG